MCFFNDLPVCACLLLPVACDEGQCASLVEEPHGARYVALLKMQLSRDPGSAKAVRDARFLKQLSSCGLTWEVLR